MGSDRPIRRLARAGALLAALAAAFAAGRLGAPRSVPPGAPATPESEDTARIELHNCISGIWGRLCFDDSVIEIPEALVPRRWPPPAPTVWHLPVGTAAEAASFLERAGLPRQAAERLASRAEPGPDGLLAVAPDDDFVIGLSPETRLSLYGALARVAANTEIAWPMRLGKRAPVGWLDGADLRPETVDLVRRLIYRVAGVELLADLELVRRRLGDAEESNRLYRALSREATLIAYLVVRPGDDVRRIAAYWGAPDRDEALSTLLDATLHGGAPRPVPVGMLLPRFARDRLHRYWRPTDPPSPHCHYTALNFFSEVPDARFMDLGEVAAEIERSYDPVPAGAPQLLGDLVVLRRPEGIIHSCNVLAGDLVFTKNGAALGQPWHLAFLSDLVAYYSYPDPVEVTVLRRRDRAALAAAAAAPGP